MFFCEFCKIFKNAFIENTSKWLLLNVNKKYMFNYFWNDANFYLIWINHQNKLTFNRLSANPQNGQTHSNKSFELFECAWPFCGLELIEFKVVQQVCLNE